MKCHHLFFLLVFLIFADGPVRPDVFYYPIKVDEDDGMELNDSTWMENGYESDEPNNYLGRVHGIFFDGALRFHLEDRLQGESFALARIKGVPTVSNIQSRVKLIIRGVDADSPAGFSQDNRPSQQWPLVTTSVPWEISSWPVNETKTIVQSPDIAPIINEILARPGWGGGQEGKTIAILMDEDNNSPDEVNYVGFEDYYGGDGRSAELELYESAVDTFIGGPVLSKPGFTDICLSFVTSMDTDFYVVLGESPDTYTQAIGRSQTELPKIDPIFGQAAWSSRALEITGLAPASRYYYRVIAKQNGTIGWDVGPENTFMTRRPPGESFDFVVLADSHAGSLQMPDAALRESGFVTIENARQNMPDFAILGGDEGCTDGSESLYDAFIRYSRARTLYGRLGSQASLFLVLGNHEGECSFYPEQMQNFSYETRQKFFPNPDHTTYEFAGGPKQNYYAWEWGDALFVCLDICFDTGPISPLNVEPYGIAWTLGLGQRIWLETVLASSDARWKFIFAHHILASYRKNGYGRGGAAFAHEWEQGEIHRMMRQYGAQIFFHSHDHVFADGLADGIHYTLCSMSTGLGVPNWASNPYFIDAYPYGFDVSKGHIHVSVSPRSVWVEQIQSSLDDGLNNRIIHGYHLADVTVSLIPPPIPDGPWDIITIFSNCPEISPSLPDTRQIPGETVSFSAVFQNHSETSQTFDYRISVSFENGGEFIIDGQTGVRLASSNTASFQSTGPGDILQKNYSIHIPQHAGAYTVTAETGEYPDTVMSIDAFTREVDP